MFILIKGLVLIVSILLSVAFFTLLERKGLSLLQLRSGPSQAGFKGVFQPFSDAIKLFVKELSYASVTFVAAYLFPSFLSFFMVLLLWLGVSSPWGFLDLSLSLVYVMVCLSVGVYYLLGAGSLSASQYSKVGGVRALAQSISYEVVFFLVLLSLVMLCKGYGLSCFSPYSLWFFFLGLPLTLVWLITLLAETGRAPFDFAEGESELVSGFSTEYSGGSFALFFLGEYGSMLFMGVLFTFLFLGGEQFFFTLALVYIFIWARSAAPRHRYDKLMGLAWFILLPLVLAWFTFGVSCVI